MNSIEPHFILNDLTSSYIRAYYQTFDEINAQKRGYSHGTECEEKYIKSIRNVEINQEPLKLAIDEANVLLSDYSKLNKIPWNIFAFNPENKGEFPFPHTHGDSIFIPYNWDKREVNLDNIKIMASTLVHEKIHIFQRVYPLETHFLIENVWNHSFYDHIKNYETRYNRNNNNLIALRRNPDTNHFLYMDEKNELILPKFKKTNDESHEIIDSRDHPFEMMAYKMTDYIEKRSIPSKEEKEWMEEYL